MDTPTLTAANDAFATLTELQNFRATITGDTNMISAALVRLQGEAPIATVPMDTLGEDTKTFILAQIDLAIATAQAAFDAI